ncbi:YeeE/YedE family protein [Motiliproteus sp.]|uniref:YeeE/YedE family protein n=1 Tax=Motiliproteus sp. TaxID=1898955 RepID=UPI003BAA433D
MLVSLTPSGVLLALAGGGLIGLSAIVLLWSNGRIAGISGILFASLQGKPDSGWRWMFLLGLVLGGLLFHALTGQPQPAPPQASIGLLMLAGLLVGLGTRLGSGCTSGHGVCGLARFSVRSLAATLTFIGSGMLTVFFLG